jgi:hypothetical protein
MCGVLQILLAVEIENAKIVLGIIVLGRIIVQSHKLTLWHDGSGGTNPLC